MSGEIKELYAELNDSIKVIDQLRANNDHLRQDNERLKGEVESLRKAEGTMCAEIDLRNEELQTHKKCLFQMQNAAKDLAADLEQAKEMLWGAANMLDQCNDTSTWCITRDDQVPEIRHWVLKRATTNSETDKWIRGELTPQTKPT